MIGIIGAGRFGRLMAGYLAADFAVGVCSRRPPTAELERAGVVFESLADVCRRRIVIPAVPISALERVLGQIAPLLLPRALVMDVCSVKIYPSRLMARLLPESVSILASHPMFGPDSAADSLAGKKIVVCPQRIGMRLFHRIKVYLATKGLAVIETSPAEHDRQIAFSLALTHFLGRSLSRCGAAPMPIDTEGYQRLLYTLETVEHDTWQLFEDMHRYNPFARRAREAFLTAAGEIHRGLDEKSEIPEAS